MGDRSAALACTRSKQRPYLWTVSALPSRQDRPGHGGGSLNGKVLLPKEALIHAIGGRGCRQSELRREWHAARGNPEAGPEQRPGASRIEVSPPGDERTCSWSCSCRLPECAPGAARSSARIRQAGRPRDRRAQANHALLVRAGLYRGRGRGFDRRRSISLLGDRGRKHQRPPRQAGSAACAVCSAAVSEVSVDSQTATSSRD